MWCDWYFKTIVWFEFYIYIPRVLHVQIKPYWMTYWIESVESTIPSVCTPRTSPIYILFYLWILPILKKNSSTGWKIYFGWDFTFFSDSILSLVKILFRSYSHKIKRVKDQFPKPHFCIQGEPHHITLEIVIFKHFLAVAFGVL